MIEKRKFIRLESGLFVHIREIGYFNINQNNKVELFKSNSEAIGFIDSNFHVEATDLEEVGIDDLLILLSYGDK